DRLSVARKHVLERLVPGRSRLPLTPAGPGAQEIAPRCEERVPAPDGPALAEASNPSSGGTKLGLDGSVVACTNSLIAVFAAPSFHEASGSVCAKACGPEARPMAAASTKAKRTRARSFTVGSSA